MTIPLPLTGLNVLDGVVHKMFTKDARARSLSIPAASGGI
jgi:hypothetical protein